MIISKANSVRFWQYALTTLPTFDNRQSAALHLPDLVPQRPSMVMNVGQSVEIQVIVPDGRTVGSTTVYSSGLTFSTATKILDISTDSGDYDLYKLTLTATSESQNNIIGIREIDGVNLVDLHFSEPIDVYDLSDFEMSRKGFLKLQWTDTDNKFLFYYQAAAVCEMWVKGRMYKYKPKSESVIFSSDEETIKLKESIKRTLELEIQDLNVNISEVIAVALAMETFKVNGVEFVSEEQPEITTNSNYASVKVVLTQTNVPGLNTIGLTDPENTDCMQFKINPVQLAYIPSLTGNTTNLGEWVIASDGSNWIIDFDGRAKKWESSTGLPVVENLTNAGAKYVTVVETLPGTSIDAHLSVFLNGNRLQYSGSSSATHPREYGLDALNNRIYVYNTLLSTDVLSIVIIKY